MNILIAPDSFKDCLTANEVGEFILKGLKKSELSFSSKILPMADGGEGTVYSLVDATGGNIQKCKVLDPLLRETEAFYGILGDGKTAVIEMAAASGIELLSKDERDPWITTTYGTGQLIKQALDLNCRRIIIGIGGSATNDGGTGMAKALGIKFLNSEGKILETGGGALSELASIDISGLDKRLKNTEIIVACDVSNPLIGNEGASHVYGPQKGADREMVLKLDRNLALLADIIERDLGKSIAHVPGAGAAGGLGGGLMAFIDGKLQSGFAIVSREVELDKHIQWANVIITGEGKIDFQTKFGKTPQGVANAGRKHQKRIIAIAGTLGENYEELYASGFDAIFSIVDKPMQLSEALEHAPMLLQNCGRAIGSLLCTR
jgi:glycerate kinase